MRDDVANATPGRGRIDDGDDFIGSITNNAVRRFGIFHEAVGREDDVTPHTGATSRTPKPGASGRTSFPLS